MALKVGELFAALSLKKDAFDKGLSSSRASASAWAGKMGGIFKTAGKAIAVGLAVGIVAIVAIGKEAAQNAVEQERATARVKAAYKDQAEAVSEWASVNSKAWGVNDDVLEISMAKYGDWGKNVGMSMEEAIAGGEAMSQRAAEISLATGKSFEEVFNGLFKGQQGMTRGLKEYGITVDKQALMNEALKQGWIKEGEAMDAATAARARGNLIMQQSSQFTEIAAGMQDSMTLKTRQMGATMDEIMDTLGVIFLNLAEAVLPYVADAFQGLADWVVGHMPEIQATIETAVKFIGAAFTFISEEVIPVLAAAFQWIADNIFPLFQQASNKVASDVLPALGRAFDFITNDVIPALGKVFEWIRNNILPPLQSIFETFTTVVLPALREAFKGVQAWIKANWPAISTIVQGVANAVKTAFDIIAAVIKVAMPIIIEIAKVVFPMVGTAASVLLNAISTAFKAIGAVWKTASDVAKTTSDAVEGAWKGLTSFFSNLWKTIGSIIRGGINTVIRAVNSMIRALNGIQIHIPGFDTPVGKIASFDWGGLGLGYIPYLAKGTRNWPGGLAWVGEQGPELVNLPHGADVYSNRESRGMMGGDTWIINGIQPGDVEREVRRVRRREVLSWSLEGR